MSAGNYHLQLIAIDAFGNQSLAKNIFLEIKPYFYRTWWFIACLSLLLLIGIYLFVAHRIQKIRATHRLKEQVLNLEHEKLKTEHKETILLKEYGELEQKALLLQMNPHFIFNSINTIQGLYKREREKADEYLIKFSNLLRQILDFSQQKIISLDQEVQFLKNYLDINKLRFENDFEYQFNLQANINPASIGISPMILQPFVENALIHGIQSLQSNGQIELNFNIEKELLICEIVDNGVGREKANELGKYNMHASLGMDITERRLTFFNKGTSNSSLKIIDLKNNSGEAIGTKVIVRLTYTQLYS